jgi:hypothetical protein
MSSLEVPPFTLSEEEVVAYCDLLVESQHRSAPHSWASSLYVPLALGVVLMVFSALSGRGDFGRLLLVGTVAYLGGYFALRYELSRHSMSWLVAYYRGDPLHQGPIRIALCEDGVEDASANFVARFAYRAFADVEITERLILGWLGPATALPIPIRVFADRGEAEGFANDLKQRIDRARPLKESAAD